MSVVLDETALIEARILEAEFIAGDPLAPFACTELWVKKGFHSDTLPSWVIAHLTRIAAEYMKKGHEARKAGRKPEPFEKIAGLGGVQKKPSAWGYRQKIQAAWAFAQDYNAIVAEARICRLGRPTTLWLINPLGISILTSDSKYRPYRIRDQTKADRISPDTEPEEIERLAQQAFEYLEPIDVLDRRGRPTKEFTITLARQHEVISDTSMVTDDAQYRAAKRLIKIADGLRESVWATRGYPRMVTQKLEL